MTPPSTGRRRSTRRLAAFAAAGLVLAGVLGFFAWAAALELPAGALGPANIASVRVLAADGKLLREVLSREDGRARWVPLTRVAPDLIQATLAGEDQRFFIHGGIDWWSMLRAAALNVRQGRIVSGGSTITMQLVRLLRPAPRSYYNKAEEMVLAHKLEQRLTKRQILWQYLNRAPYGNGTFGVEAAAQRYLSKPAAQLSLAEATLLAALPRSPSGYNPYRHRARLLKRQRYLLALMVHQGRVDAERRRLALAEPIDWDAAARPFDAPHLVQRVLALPRTRGAAVIRTTLDLKLQRAVQTAVATTVERMREQGISNAAVLVVDNATGDVLAHVGSADFFSEQDAGQVDGTRSLRQPGSTMKPFTYALALEQGLTPATLLRDLPAHFATAQGDYAPKNYDETFHGPVRLRVALGSSYNVPAVRTTQRVGVERLLARLRDMGFSSLTKPARHYGLGLTLGNGEVTLHELVAAYSALARGGRTLPLRVVRAAITPEGQRLAQPDRVSKRVFGRRVTHLISHMLADGKARLPAFGRNTVLDVGFEAAVKTGTSKDFRDNWTVGYTPQVTVGVWVGNFDGASMENVSGISGAGPLWAEVMVAAMRGQTEARFDRPGGLVTRRVCPLSGALAGPHCSASLEEHFIAETAPSRTCSLHREVALDRRNGMLAGAGCPEPHVERRTMTVYPPVYRAWAHSRGVIAPPTTYSPHCPDRSGSAARVSIRFPQSGDRYHLDPDLRRNYQKLPLEATVRGWVSEVRWLVDDHLIARAPYPYTARWTIRPGRHTIIAVLPDGKRSAPVTVNVGTGFAL